MAIDPTIPTWPRQLSPARVARRRVHPLNFGPEVISGAPQDVVADAGRWQLDYQHIPVHGDKLMIFRAVVADRCAPLQPIYVPVRDYLRTPRRRAGLATGASPIPFSDDSTFSDGTAFLDQPVDFVVTTNAAARATALTVTLQGPAGVALTAGNFIGIGERSYFVKKIFAWADGAVGHFDLTIWPYLRAAAVAGDSVWTEDPVVKCNIDPKIAELSEDLDYDIYGFIDAIFVESRW